jgi:hypothetical protein
MTRSIPIHRMLLAALVAAVAVSTVTQLAYAGPQVPTVPDTIAVEEGHKLYLVAHAVGVQIYPCVPTSTGYAWGPSTPQANLYDDNGKPIGTHFAGPSWQAKDGSKVMAQRKDGVTVDPTAIPWLLLTAKSPTAGLDGDRLVATTFIQRIQTVGGVAPPAADCNAATVGTTEAVPYTADYLFWKKTV